jgi:hypothetical protein
MLHAVMLGGGAWSKIQLYPSGLDLKATTVYR